MSFVGIIRCRDGIVGFADTRSSVPIPLGGLGLDVTRGEVKKIFRTKDAVIVTCGLNVVVRAKGRAALEDYVHFEDGLSIGQSLFGLHLDLLKDGVKDTFTFIIGERCEDGFTVRAYEVSASEIKLTNCFTGYILTGGTQWYVKQADDIVTRINHLTVDVTLEKLPAILKGMIEEADRMGGYNPVGGEIRIESLK